MIPSLVISYLTSPHFFPRQTLQVNWYRVVMFGSIPFNVSDLPPNCNVWPPECVICDRIPWSHWVALVRSDSCTWCWLALMVPILLSILTIAIALAPTPWNQRTATSSSVGIGLKEKKNFFGLVILLLYVARQRQWQIHTQIHTYTNTQIRSAWKTHHVLYFLKAWGQGY